MSQLSIDQVAQLALSAGFRKGDDSAATAVAIAKAESNFITDNIGDIGAGESIGLWQINLRSNPQYNAQDLFDPSTNAKAAYAISGGGTNFNPWCTYRPSACGGAGNNAYAQFLPAARAAVSRASTFPHYVLIGGMLTLAVAGWIFRDHLAGSLKALRH
jgi:soluble lytic murein transglycosylase-like protein